MSDFTPMSVRPQGRDPTQADVQLRVTADGDIGFAGYDADAEVLRAVAVDAAGRVVVVGDDDSPLPVKVVDRTPGSDRIETASVDPVAVESTEEVVSFVPAAGKRFYLHHVNVTGDGGIEWEILEGDGEAAEAFTEIDGAYTSQGSPSAKVDLDSRYSLLGDGTKRVLVRARNLDVIQAAAVRATLVGYEEDEAA